MSQLLIPAIAALSVALSMGGSEYFGQDMGANTPSIVLGGGAFDFHKNAEQDKAGDIRAEYRFGDPFFLNVKPLIAIEGTTDGSGAVFAGLVSDWSYHNWVFSPSFAVGVYGHGDGKDLGSPLEFRSQLEAGYRFDNSWRVTGYLSHISNAEIGDTNPGAEQIGINLHIPTDVLFPR